MGMLKFVTVVTIILSVSLSTNAQWFRRRYNRPRSLLDEADQPAPASGFFGLPIPNGPFYGQPFDVSATMARQLPFTVSGMCEAGKVYNVTKGEDLLNYRNELECLHNSGLVPKKVPEGPFYGTILSVSNTQFFNSYIGNLWKGKMVTKITCNGNETFMGWNNMMGTPTAPFVATIQPLALNLAPGEYYDGKESLIMDYTQDLNQACPDYRKSDSAAFRRPNLSGAYPMNQMVDALRFIGKQEDGGSIYLGKSYLRDFYRPDLQAATVGYWFVVNFDENATPTLFKSGDSLPPLKNGFKFMHPGSPDLFLRVLPFDNLLTNPIRTVGKFYRGVLKTGSNSLRYAGERTFGYGNFMNNQKRFRDAFKAGREFGRRN